MVRHEPWLDHIPTAGLTMAPAKGSPNLMFLEKREGFQEACNGFEDNPLAAETG